MKRFLLAHLCATLVILHVLPVTAQDFYQRLGVGLNLDAIRLLGGEKEDSIWNGWGGLFVRYGVTPHLSLSYAYNYGWVRPRKPGSYIKSNPDAPFKTFLFSQDICGSIHLPQMGPLHPFVSAGTGLVQWDLRNVSEGGSLFRKGLVYGERIHDSMVWNYVITAGIGTDIFMSENLAIQVHCRYSHLFDQRTDNIGTQDANTGVIQVGVNLAYYFFGWKDLDGDGIADKVDLAISQPEDMDGFEDDDGAPDLDNDNDGVPDLVDQLPLVPEDLDGFQDEDGEPELDNDYDGIIDSKDKAPNDPEDFDGFQDEDGIPDEDNDRDGIPDLVDGCPNKPETINGFQDQDGCPDEPPPQLLQKGENLILKGINFELGSAELTMESRPVLDEVFVSLQAYPEVVLEIRGYTDNSGSRQYNLRLSEDRANSVKDYLVNLGLEPERLLTKGFGPDNPVASNATAEGRAKNRRIEFFRLK